MKPSSVIDDWVDDSPREGPLSQHLAADVDKLPHTMREADFGLNNLVRSVADLRLQLREICRSGYPDDLHAQAAEMCRSVELARSQLSAAQAEIYKLLARLDTTHG
jgi:hypothetical protein